VSEHIVGQIDQFLKRLDELLEREVPGWAITSEIILNDVEEFLDMTYPRDSKDYRRLSEALRSTTTFLTGSRWDVFWWAQGHPVAEALQVIRHRVQKGQTLPIDARPNEEMIAAQSPHSAYVVIRDIVEEAKQSITLVDPYVDRTLFPLLSNVGVGVTLRILTRARTVPTDFPLEAAKFSEEHQVPTEVRCGLDDSHDRFLVVDGRLYFSGASFKQLGEKLSVVASITTQAKELSEEIENRWAAASKV